jgi:protein phosphatase
LPLLQEDGNPIQAPIQEVMTDAVQAAHTALFDPDPEQDGGTTLTTALILGRRLYIAHVGDTRVYLHTDEKLEMLTTDHSLVQRLRDVGQLTAEEAHFYQYKNVLLRALGQGEDIEVDTYIRLLPKAGTLLLCTDGLSGLVTDSEIKQILDEGVSLEEAADNLVDAAMAAGGYDNITAILVNFHL